jgi:hypothetical protein
VVVAAGADEVVATGVGVNVAPVAVVVRDIELAPSTGKFWPGANCIVAFWVYSNCCASVSEAF